MKAIMLTIANLDLAKTNSHNITSVENEYDRAMAAEGCACAADPVADNGNELRTLIIRGGCRQTWESEIRWHLSFIRKTYSATQVASMLAMLKSEEVAKAQAAGIILF